MDENYGRDLGDLVTWIYLAENEVRAALKKARATGAPSAVINNLATALNLVSAAKKGTNDEIDTI